MGSSLSTIMNAPSIHIQAQSKINAARVLQKAGNDAQMTLTEARKLVQTANNAASDTNAASARLIQTANNDSSVAMRDAQLRMQTQYNEQAVRLASAKRMVQDARNERAASTADVARWTASIQNQRALKYAGEAFNELGSQITSAMDQATIGRAQDRVAASSVLGASVAQAASNGIGTGMVSAFNQAVSLRQALKEEGEDRALSQRLDYARRSRAEGYAKAAGGLADTNIVAEMDREAIIAEQDNSYIGAQIDYTPVIADHDFEVYSPNLDYTVYMDHKAMSAFDRVAAITTAAAATYFGGPQAGAAVLDYAVGQNQAENGDFAGSAQSMGNAFKNGVGGFKTYRADTTNGKSGTPWGQQYVSKIGASLKL